jgi:lysine 6-dehydrogenase
VVEQNAYPNKENGPEMKIVVLGAGLMGRAVVYDLSGAREVKNIVVADFDRRRAQEVARKFGRGISSAAFADVRDTPHLAKLLHGCDVVVNCSQYNWNLDVMRAALAARVNYMDLGGLYHVTRKQLALDRDFRRIGKLAIPGMGGAPGITNVMARALADSLDRVDAIKVYNAGADEQHYDSPIAYSFSIATILDELTMAPIHFVGGRYVEKEMLSEPETETFPAPIGKIVLRHSIHSELGTLAGSFRKKGVREVFFKINYDPKLVGLVRSLVDAGFTGREPIAVNGTQVAPRAVLLAAEKNFGEDAARCGSITGGSYWSQRKEARRCGHGNVCRPHRAAAIFGRGARHRFSRSHRRRNARSRRNSRRRRAGARNRGAGQTIFWRTQKARIHFPQLESKSLGQSR